MMPSRRTAITAVLLTIASIVPLAFLGLGNPERLPRCLTNPLLAFETLASPDEAKLIWDQLGALQPHLKWGFYADFGFIAAYGFLFVTLGRMARARGVPYGKLAGTVAIAASLLAAACDVGENVFALRAIAALETGAPPALDWVRRFSLTKWGLLGAALMLFFFTFRPTRRGPALYRLNALSVCFFSVLSGAACVAGVIDNTWLELAFPFLAPATLLQLPLYLAYWDVLMNISAHSESHTALEMWQTPTDPQTALTEPRPEGSGA